MSSTTSGTSVLKDHAEQFLRLSGDLCLLVGRDGVVRESVGGSMDLLGWSSEELRARPIVELFHSAERPAIAQFLDELAAAHPVADLHCRVRTRAGAYRWTNLRGVYDAEKACFYLVGKDIHALREREAFSELFFEAAPVGLNLCAMDGTWIESNPAFLKMIGYPKEEADGRLTYWRLTPRNYDEMERVQLERLQTGGKYGPYEKEFVRADGTLVPVRLSGFVIHKDGQPFIWSIIEDISTERRLKSEVEAKTALLEAIIDNIPTALFVKNATDKKFTLWNKAAEQVLKRDRREVIGKTAHEIWPAHQADRYLEDDLKVVEQGQLVDIEEEPSALPGGETILLHTKKFPLRFRRGVGPELLLCISEDITDRKKLETDLRAAIDVRDEFLSVASHELKTPLTALSLQLQLLDRCLDGREAPRDAHALVIKAVRSCRQLTDLLNELLDITRIRTGKLTLAKRPVDLTLAVENLVATMSEEIRKSGSQLRIATKGPVVGHWDPNRIHQVICNLVSNALKFGAGKPIDIAVWSDADSAFLEVKDRGMGIAPEVQPRIFQRFERGVSGEEVSGLGLGLYIVHQVLEAHGGSIHVESVPGEGTRFIVVLPRGGESGASRKDARSLGVLP